MSAVAISTIAGGGGAGGVSSGTPHLSGTPSMASKNVHRPTADAYSDNRYDGDSEYSVRSVGDGTCAMHLGSRDLVLLAEFDEISGPRPLMTIPKKAHTWMDLDSFSLRIMTVDLQQTMSSSMVGSSGANENSKFRVVEDSQVMLSDPQLRIAAYVRHFTLYDIRARGFVRPMCLCYVTSDTNKILKYFSQLSNDFAKVCHLLKYGNQYKFLSDIDVQQHSIRRTLELLIRSTTQPERDPEIVRIETETILNNGDRTLHETSDDNQDAVASEHELNQSAIDTGACGPAELDPTVMSNNSCVLASPGKSTSTSDATTSESITSEEKSVEDVDNIEGGTVVDNSNVNQDGTLAATQAAELQAKKRHAAQQALDDIMFVRNEILSRPWDEHFRKRHRHLIDVLTKSPRKPPSKSRHSQHNHFGYRSRPHSRDRSYTTLDPTSIPRTTSTPLVDENTRNRSSSFSVDPTTPTTFDVAHTDPSKYLPKYMTAVVEHGRDTVQMKTVEELSGERVYGAAYKRMQDTLGCFRQDNMVLMMHAAEARSMEPSPHILTIGRCSLLNFKLLPAPRKYRVRDSAVDDDTNSNGRSPKHMNVASRQQLFYHQQNSPRHHTHPDFASPGRGSTVGDVSTFATNVSNFSSPPAVDTLEATVARMERYGGSPLTRPSSQCASPSKAPDVGLQTHGPIEGLHVPIDAVVLSSTPTDPSTIPSLRRSNSVTPGRVERNQGLSLASIYTDATEGDLRSVSSKHDRILGTASIGGTKGGSAWGSEWGRGTSVSPGSTTPALPGTEADVLNVISTLETRGQGLRALQQMQYRVPTGSGDTATGTPTKPMTPSQLHFGPASRTDTGGTSDHGSVTGSTHSHATKLSSCLGSSVPSALPRRPHISDVKGSHHPGRIFVPSAVEHVALDSKYKPGYGLLMLRRQCSFVPQLAYSLLCGRPVVVLAQKDNEESVRSLVRALWLFVPGHSVHEKVIAWRQSHGLRLEELAQVKLIGLSKCTPDALPKVVERFVTWLDFENEILFAPHYHSGFLQHLFVKKRDIPNEATLLAEVHAAYLTLANHAFLFYHLVCMAEPSTRLHTPGTNTTVTPGTTKHDTTHAAVYNTPAKDPTPSHRRSTPPTLEVGGASSTPMATQTSALDTANITARCNAFHETHSISRCDAQIVEYLSEVVKLQQVTEYKRIYGTDEHTEWPYLRLQLRTCTRHTNLRGPMDKATTTGH